MNKQDCIALQEKLNALGAGLKVDGVYGPKTQAAEAKYLGGEPEELKPLPKRHAPPWLTYLRKFSGKKETDPEFSKEISSYWKYVGLPGYKSISGRARAWCAVFIVVGGLATGQKYLSKGGAGAANHCRASDVYDYINYMKDGIPEGAILGVQTGGNHVTMANGDCAPSDLVGKGATVAAYGGNQGDRAKVSTYAVSSIKCVGWYKSAKERPRKISVSRNCSGKSSGSESTR